MKKTRTETTMKNFLDCAPFISCTFSPHPFSIAFYLFLIAFRLPHRDPCSSLVLYHRPSRRHNISLHIYSPPSIHLYLCACVFIPASTSCVLVSSLPTYLVSYLLAIHIRTVARCVGDGPPWTAKSLGREGKV
ncbi:hypothetical protein R3P38DRAFT_935928 [Favolaschia claudopus]|uniref:Uncharacterized protein n=1 Tax=Favolaschia claudopus TaxID=2862362 RepID=A0AAV9YZ97_9AGAR